MNHPRPFFYVHPPVQPFYTYQWHTNNPFSPHNVPASGFHFGRPYMVPYSYLQYPGYVVSQPAMHPVDYRRIYERNVPHAPSATDSDITFRHQHCNAQRETTCAGAQTEPCDALNKLIECLDQLRAGEGSSQRELDSGVVSQTSGLFSPVAEIKKDEDNVLCGSMLTHCKAEEACHVGDFNQQEDWSLDLGKETPLDSSSVHEGAVLDEEDQYLHQEYTDSHCIISQNQSLLPISNSERNYQDKKVSHEVLQNNEEIQWNCSNGIQPSSESSPAQPSSSRTTEGRDPEDIQKPPADVAGDFPCCILRLPFEKVLSSSVYVPSATSSLGSPFSYRYCPPQLASERMSVLSPSLDELSSHDEVLSTDIEDKDLFPTRMYTRGKFAEVTSKKNHPSVGGIHSDMCLLYPKRLTCAMCGSNTFREMHKHKNHHSERSCYKNVDYSDEEAIAVKGGDCEVRKTCKHLRGTVTNMPKKTHPLLKHRVRLAQHREKVQEEAKTYQSEASCSEHFCCDKCTSSPEKHSGHSTKERHCRTVGVISDQILWEGVARSKTCKSQSLLQRRERQRQRKACFTPQETRCENLIAADDEEDEDEDECREMLRFHKGQGTTKRGGAR
ncbi:bucky ball-like isoform X2 [Brachyhypopomus gauderio]